MKARIPKGTPVYSMRTGEWTKAGRTYTVTIDHTLTGHNGRCYCHTDRAEDSWADVPEVEPRYGRRPNGHGKHCYPPKKPTVRWAGSGGYWSEAAADDVELIEDES